MPPKSTQHAQLGVSTRARKDPTRRVGTANAVAAGVNMGRTSVMSDRELAWIRRLANESDEANTVTARQQEEARRKGLSDARTAGWTDTIQARQEQFLDKKRREAEEAEARKAALDELYAQQEEEEHKNAIAARDLRALKDDPRGRNVNSMLLLDAALKGREEQIAYKAYLQALEEEDARREKLELQMKAWGETAEEQQKRAEARQRNVEEKNANLEMVLFQIQERRGQRSEEKEDRAYWAQQAAEEAQENAEEDAQRRQMERENGLYNKSQSRKAQTKADRLRERIGEDAATEATRLREEARMDKLKQSVMEKQQRKLAEFEGRKQGALTNYAQTIAEPDPKQRTQDRFEEKGESFLKQMASNDDERVRTQREYAARGDFGEDVIAGHRTAAASARGFLNDEEERAYLAEMRTYPEKVRAEDEAEATKRRAELDRIKSIQKMQAEQKHENDRRCIEQEREERRQQQAYREQEDAEYQRYIDSRIPDSMNPALRDRAKQLQ